MGQRFCFAASLCFAVCFCFAACLAASTPGFAFAQAPSETTPSVARAKGAVPVRWSKRDAKVFAWAEDREWLVVQERGVTGEVVEGAKRREIEQTRLRILHPHGIGAADPPTELGVLQHLDNLEVALLSPEDERLEDPGPLLNDPKRPWPNLCGLSVLELDTPIDLNGNGRRELVVKAFSTVADPAASRLLLVEPDEKGWPHLLFPSGIVGTIRFDDGILTDIRWSGDDPTPVLYGEFLPLHECRFLALLGIRGQSQCENCCGVPIVLKRGAGNLYHPVYDRWTQSLLLERTRGELSEIRDGRPDAPLSSLEQALLARAAAFYYLTGSAENSRPQLVQDLGARANQVQVQLLLRKLDKFFLLSPS